MATVKPRPSAWEWHCYRCGTIRYTCHDPAVWTYTKDLPECECGTSGSPRGVALWSHEWAAVAWMAAAEFEGWLCLYSEGQHGDRESWREGIADHLNGKAGHPVDWSME